MSISKVLLDDLLEKAGLTLIDKDVNEVFHTIHHAEEDNDITVDLEQFETPGDFCNWWAEYRYKEGVVYGRRAKLLEIKAVLGIK